MRFSNLLRGTAATVGALLIVAIGAAPALAASAADSIVPVGAPDGAWTTVSAGADTTTTMDNYSVTYQRADGMIGAVSLIVLPSPDLAQQVVQSVVDSQNAKAKNGIIILPSAAYGDANAWELSGSDSATGMIVQGRLFVDKGTVVFVMAAGPPAVADDVKAAADTLANAQDNILPSNL
jgi:hypothetical protein